MKVIFSLFVVAVACVIHVDASCDVKTASGCFTILNNPFGGWNKQDASGACRNKKARLADIRSGDEFDAIFQHLKEKRPSTMVLLDMSYKAGKLLLSGGGRVPFAPVWYEDHPRSEKNFNDVMIIVTEMSRYSGFMNAENNCVYSTILCRDV